MFEPTQVEHSAQQAWICCQIGAREHYAIARALHGAGQLGALLTDIWLRPGHPLSWRRQLQDRYHPGLDSAPVYANNFAALGFELKASMGRLHGWPLMIRRNGQFQRWAVAGLSRIAQSLAGGASPRPIMFAYSYAALEIIRFAKQQNWPVILGQIDPGPLLAETAQALAAKHPAALPGDRVQDAVPASYWRAWREECNLADRILVNSPWSRDALVRAGLPPRKLTVLPLAYEAPPGARDFRRQYPPQFTAARPLRVLFLGQVTLLKGILPLLDAARCLANDPVEFFVVGKRQIKLPDTAVAPGKLHWFDQLPRSAVQDHFRNADVFLFPTHGDGFGITQLEAQAWQLPVIASRFCGEVVQDGVNGVVLRELSGNAIAEVLHSFLRDPDRLRRMSESSGVDRRFSMCALATALIELSRNGIA